MRKGFNLECCGYARSFTHSIPAKIFSNSNLDGFLHYKIVIRKLFLGHPGETEYKVSPHSATSVSDVHLHRVLRKGINKKTPMALIQVSVLK